MMLMLISKALPKITVILGKEKTFIVEQSRQLKQTSSMFSSLLFHMKKKKKLWKKTRFYGLTTFFFSFFFRSDTWRAKSARGELMRGHLAKTGRTLPAPQTGRKGGKASVCFLMTYPHWSQVLLPRVDTALHGAVDWDQGQVSPYLLVCRHGQGGWGRGGWRG